MSESSDKITDMKKRAAALRGFAARNRDDFRMHGIEFYKCLAESQDKTAADLEAEAEKREAEKP